MSTPAAVTPSVRLAGTAWNGPVSTGLPTTATRVKLNPPKDPAMMRNQTRKCVTKSETPQISVGAALMKFARDGYGKKSERHRDP